MSNPLLEDTTLPPFQSIKVEHIVPAIESLIQENKDFVAQKLSEESTPTWENFIQPMDEVSNKLNKAFSPVGHMNSVVNSPELREAYEKCLPMLSELSTEMGQNKELYEAYVKLKDSAEYKIYSQAQKQAIDNNLRDFKLSGIALPEDKQKKFGELKKKLSELSSKFSNNVLDATMAWSKNILDKDELKGIPESSLESAREAAKEKELEGYYFTLDYPSFFPILTYCENRELRKEVYTAFCTRASDQGPSAGKFDNSKIMEELLELKLELAKLLDFNNYSELSIATKMASSTDEVLGFLNDLAEKSFPQAKAEYDELVAFAKEELGLDSFEAWDGGFVAEKLRQHKFDISQEELRPYFSADKVVNGMFNIVNKLFGIIVKQISDFDSWHKDVRFYKIFKDGQHIASFYLDLFARAHKRGGAWMDDCRPRMTYKGSQQLPVAYLVCNFTGPVGDKPALLTHNEVTTLFHEFGHGIHHMLTEVNVLAVSGINGVAWDAVELPSQFLENWCWQKESLDMIAEHFETGETIPDELISRLLAAKNFNSATAMMRQLQFALFDFRLHTEYGTSSYKGIQELLDEVRELTSVAQTPEFNRFQHGFSHIFAGGYSAGYYSYKWAEVLSADAFSKFEETGIFNCQTGEEFLEHILRKGGSSEAAELFKAFRGRAPKVDALLRHCGINA
ncbi:MAG: oligopeptidase A [Lentisphaeraceae bacterium]|nr:oligopeptidase A [Lentisphaeraceae bacterium]